MAGQGGCGSWALTQGSEGRGGTLQAGSGTVGVCQGAGAAHPKAHGCHT